MTVIGISGTDGAGKGTVVDYLVTHHGFVHYSARSLIAQFVEAKGLPITRNQLRLTANELRAEYGDDFVVRQAYEQAMRDGAKKIIVESIRAVAEAQYLKTQGGTLWAVDADAALRFTRVQARRSLTDRVDLPTFLAQEAIENNDPDPHGMQKTKVIQMADVTLMNNGTYEALGIQVEQALAAVVAGAL